MPGQKVGKHWRFSKEAVDRWLQSESDGAEPQKGRGYPHGHVPSPLQVADHVGDADMDQLLWELLVLSKMKWNSAGFAGLIPITIRFSRLVGDIMREIPPDREPEPQFRYYI